MKRLKKGFTIFELIIVIAIIAALSAIVVPSFFGFVKNAKEAADRSLVNNLNNAININTNEVGVKPKTMHDAVRIVKRSAYTLDRLVTESNQTLVFDTTDHFFHLSGDIEPENYSNCFAIYSSMPDLSTEGPHFSIYAGEGFSTTTIENLTVGFDVGDNTNINNISYVGENDAIIRSAKGKLNINSTNATIHHYGTANEVHIESVSSNSYFEEGTASFLELKKGRVVITPSSIVGGIHLLNTDNIFDNIKIGTVEDSPVPTLTRDHVSEDTSTTEGTYDKLVATIEHLKDRSDEEPTQEFVWLRVNVESSTPTSSAIISSSSEEIEEIRLDQQSDTAKDAQLSLSDAMKSSDAEEEAIAVVEPEIFSGSVVRSGAIGYETLQEAITNSENNKMLTMLQSVTLEEPLTIDKSFTLNLNGKTITTGANTITIQDASLLIKDSLTGGTITGAVAPVVHALNSTVTLYSGKISSSKGIALKIEESSFFMSGGTLSATQATLTLTNFVACDISGGTITSSYTSTSSKYTTIYCSAQTLNTDATVLLHGSATVTATKGLGVYVKRLQVYESASITSKCYAIRAAGVTTISGGTIKTTGSYASIVVTTSGDLTISGGTITPKAGYAKVAISNNTTGMIRASSSINESEMTYYAVTYELDGITPLAYGTCYGLCQNAVSSNKIVKLVSDVNFTASTYVYIKQSIILDLNNHNITQATEAATATYLFRIAAGNVTIRGDGICSYIEPDSLAEKTTSLFYIATTAVATINIEGGTYHYSGNTADRYYIYLYSNVSGTNVMNFKGGQFGWPTYETAKFFYVRSSTYYKRQQFIFSGGSYYGIDPGNPSSTFKNYKISLKEGCTSTLNEETLYYEVA